MSDEDWVTVEAVLMTNHAIAAYGGVQFPPEVLEEAAIAFSSGSIPMQVEHDQTRPLRTRRVDAWVEERPDGVHVLRATIEIHRDDAHYVEAMRGMSVAFRAPLESREEMVGGAPGRTLIAADHAWFSDDAIEEAESYLRAATPPGVPVEAQRAYQFAFIPDPQIFIHITLAALQVISGGVAGNAVYDAIRTLLRRRQTPAGADSSATTRINFEIADGQSSIKATVITSDEAVALRALDTLSEAASQLVGGLPTPTSDEAEMLESPSPSANSGEPIIVWDDEPREWVPPR